MYSPGTIANSQRTSTKANKNGAITKVKKFSGTSDTFRYLKIFRTLTNEMPVFLLILN